jgi:hypothetical protein
MRSQIKIKIGTVTFFAMLSVTQTLEGLTSLLRNGNHIILWDIEGKTSLPQVEEKLRQLQGKYCLSDIYVVSDKLGSYRAWCFTEVCSNTLIQILADSLDIIDYNFFYWTVVRGKATLRISDKKGRLPQKIVSVVPSFPAPIPSVMEHVVYDTGLEKRGTTILLG